MPNRVFKESMCFSETIARMSDLATLVYSRLILTCDDFGLFVDKEQVIAGRCFPYEAHRFKKRSACHAFCVMDFPCRPGGVIERMPAAVREALKTLQPADCSCVSEGYFETMKEMRNGNTVYGFPQVVLGKTKQSAHR